MFAKNRGLREKRISVLGRYRKPEEIPLTTVRTVSETDTDDDTSYSQRLYLGTSCGGGTINCISSNPSPSISSCRSNCKWTRYISNQN